jgi:hypothetical protein
LEGDKIMIGQTIYSAGGLGSENRTTYGIPTAEGVFVRCGCWSGWLPQFRERVVSVYAKSPINTEYLLVADLFEARWNRQVTEGVKT